MVIDVHINEWVPINGLTQTATSYEIYSDQALTTLMFSKYNDTVNLTRIHSGLTIPAGQTYYSRTQRILSDGTILPWTPAIPVSESYNIDAFIVPTRIHIETPVLNIDTVALTDVNSTTFAISGSSFISTGDNHYATHWYITDKENNVIYSNLMDTVNLTSITLNKVALQLHLVTGIKVHAVYLSGTLVESGVAAVAMDLFSKNYSLSTLTGLVATANIVINFTKIDTTKEANIARVEVVSNGNIIFFQDIPLDSASVTIPSGTLTPATNYVLRLYTLDKGLLFKEDHILTT